MLCVTQKNMVETEFLSCDYQQGEMGTQSILHSRFQGLSSCCYMHFVIPYIHIEDTHNIVMQSSVRSHPFTRLINQRFGQPRQNFKVWYEHATEKAAWHWDVFCLLSYCVCIFMVIRPTDIAEALQSRFKIKTLGYTNHGRSLYRVKRIWANRY